jgi:beta-galactosidase
MTATVQVGANTTANVSSTFHLTGVSFWSPNTPALYKAYVSIITSRKTSSTSADQTSDDAEQISTDADQVAFGVRKISFDSTNGFVLNGVSTKLQGGCVHHANGPLGYSALPSLSANAP